MSKSSLYTSYKSSYVPCNFEEGESWDTFLRFGEPTPKLGRLPYPCHIPTRKEKAAAAAAKLAVTSKLTPPPPPAPVTSEVKVKVANDTPETLRALPEPESGKRGNLTLPPCETATATPTLEPPENKKSKPDEGPTPTRIYSGICEDRDFSTGIKLPEARSLFNYIIPELESANPTPWKQHPAIPPETLKPRILSVVSSVRLGCILDLERIANKLTDLHYNRESFTPLKLLLRNPYAVGMVFSSGNMVVTGTVSEAQNRIACRKFYVRIKFCGFPVRKPLVQIQNITSTVNLGFRVRIHDLSKCELLKGMVFPSENFSGLTIEICVPKAKIIVFQTGRALITGVVNEAQVQEAFQFIYPFAKMYAR